MPSLPKDIGNNVDQHGYAWSIKASKADRPFLVRRISDFIAKMYFHHDSSNTEQAESVFEDDLLSEDQIAALTDMRMRLLEEELIDGELSQTKRAQLAALRAFFSMHSPVPPYTHKAKLRSAIDVLKSRLEK
jgi:hypothetical protein